jgi:hypothetical protein
MVRFFGRIAFFAFATSVFAGETLTALVTAAQDFSVAIQEQLAPVQSDISGTELVEKTVSYACNGSIFRSNFIFSQRDLCSK